MSDPVLDTVKRIKDDYGVRGAGDLALAQVSVHTAFEPLRKLHTFGTGMAAGLCLGCLEAWPCQTSRLIYNSEELVELSIAPDRL